MTMSAEVSMPASIVCATGETRSVTGPPVSVGAGVTVRVGVTVGVSVIVGVGVIVGVSVMVGVGGTNTWMEPPRVAGIGSGNASTVASVTLWSVRELVPAPLPCSVMIE